MNQFFRGQHFRAAFALAVAFGLVSAVLQPLVAVQPVSAQPLVAVQPVSAQPLGGVGVLGDSNSDEYRADDCRACGTPYAATTLNWVELLARYRGVSFGAWGAWDPPRRAGYQFDWALSGATAQDMTASGQHTGLAQQIAQGLVTTVVLSVGANNFNDWNGTYASIYTGQLNGAALADYESTIAGDITLAMDTVRSAGAQQVIWNPIPDMSTDVYLKNEFPIPAQRQRVTDSYTRVNTQLTQNAHARGITVVDVGGETAFGLTHFNNQSQFVIDGRIVDLVDECWAPNCVIMPDHHVGTLGQGIYANFYFLQPLGLAPFSDHELIVNAGFPEP